MKMPGMWLGVCATSFVWLAGHSFAATRTSAEDHLRLVQKGVVPSVLVRGESPAMLSLRERMTELNVPGVSIAVIHKGRIDWARGFGVTRTGGQAVTADTLFQAASISKPVFALAVLHLVDTGKLKLDDNVNDYLKTWKVPDNEFTITKKVTLRGILSHSAGLTVHGFPGYGALAPVPTLVQILDGARPANTAAVRVDVVPGTRHRYSGGGYVVAELLLQDVTGVPLPKFMRDTVLSPLGMRRSTFEQPLPVARTAEVAMPYEGGKAVEGGPHTYPERAPAGLWTTPTDLARYALGVQAALAGKSKKVISAATARAMLTPVLGNHGVGPVIGGGTARKYFMHGGANEGYRCLLVAYESGEGAIVMTNSDSGGEIMGEVMRTIAHIYQWPDFAPPTRTLAEVGPDLLDRYIGAYEMNEGSIYVVRRQGVRLVGHMIGRTPVALYPASELELFAREVDVLVHFTLDAKGVVTAVRHRLNGYERNGPRVEDAKARPILAAVERTAQRFKDQTPHPGSEEAIRQLLAGLASGKPDYDRMVPRFAEITRQQLPALQRDTIELGALKSLTFVRVVPDGFDDFNADFENGALHIGVRLSDDGRIEGAGLRPK